MYLNTVDRAGLMQLRLPFLIGSRSLERVLGQILILLLKSSSPVLEMMVAMVARLIMPSSGCTPTRSLMKLVPSIVLEVTTMVKLALL